MTAPYDDSVQKEWKERKEKIEDYYRDMGKVLSLIHISEPTRPY